jgi:hypothetical protein
MGGKGSSTADSLVRARSDASHQSPLGAQLTGNAGGGLESCRSGSRFLSTTDLRRIVPRAIAKAGSTERTLQRVISLVRRSVRRSGESKC